MKLSYFYGLLLLSITSLVICNPINTEVVEDSEVAANIKTPVKRFDYGTYFSSIKNYFFVSDVKRNVFYDGIKNIDIYYHKNDNTKKPVVIFIYGGTWYLGEKSLYSKLGEFLRDSGYVGVIPNYVQFPFGTLEDMVYDICNSINWVYNNISKYGGDNQNMILLGHSSGAHLSALTLLKSSLRLKGKGTYSTTKAIPTFKKAVLLNGPYDFDVFNEMLSNSEIKDNSSFELLASSILGSKLSCPTDILKPYGAKSLSLLGAQQFNIIHSSSDTVVPLVSATGLKYQIERTSNIPVNLYIFEGFKHCGITEGVMNGEAYAQSVLRKVLSE